MNCAVIYSSRTGNTELLAHAIFNALSGEKVLLTAEQAAAELPETELYFVGFWTDKGTCDEASKIVLSRMKGKRVVLFGTMGMGSSDEYKNRIAAAARACLPKSSGCPGIYLCQGKMPSSVRARYEEALEKDPKNAVLHLSLENYDTALSHPDEHDLNTAAVFAKRMAME